MHLEIITSIFFYQHIKIQKHQSYMLQRLLKIEMCWKCHALATNVLFMACVINRYSGLIIFQISLSYLLSEARFCFAVSCFVSAIE